MAQPKPFLTLALLVSLATACQASPTLDAARADADCVADTATELRAAVDAAS